VLLYIEEEDVNKTHPGKAYNYGLVLGILRATKVWLRWNPRRLGLLSKRLLFARGAGAKRSRLFTHEQLVVPPVLIISVTMRCNLECRGCYSRNYPIDNEMSPQELDRLLTDAEQLGVGFVVLTGGEPFMVDGLLELLSRHPRITFLLYTNGTRIDQANSRVIYRMGNVVPLLSIEGTERQTDERRGAGTYAVVVQAMRFLKEAGAFFGFSSMVTSENLDVLGSDGFIDDMIDRGCKMGYYVNYVPCVKGAPFDLVPGIERQTWFHEQIIVFQQNKRIVLVHMPDDEYTIGGSCMAAGRGFLHINAQGFVEPCPFSHIATHTVRTASLKECLQSDLFSYIRGRPELLRKPRLGCALYENRDKLLKAAKELGAVETELSAEIPS
jgi:MoaA/NifB/PqqE/SkfB family radical SAM enzyme